MEILPVEQLLGENVQPIDNQPIAETNVARPTIPTKSPATKKQNRSKTASIPDAKPIVQQDDGGRNYTKEEVESLIISYSAEYGINSETPLCIASRESGFNQYSKNRSSSASGVFQYLNGTWKSNDEGKAGQSVFDADSNVKAAVKYMAIHKSTSPWTTAKNCPSLQFINN